MDGEIKLNIRQHQSQVGPVRIHRLTENKLRLGVCDAEKQVNKLLYGGSSFDHGSGKGPERVRAGF